MALPLTSGQLDAAHRRDVYGIVYAVSGTLKSVVSGIPDAAFHWSTKPLDGGPTSGYSGHWEPYITLPQDITAELSLSPGEVPPLHIINVMVKNLPFRHVESLLTAITDGVWQWEGTTASLYAAYQKKEQAPSDIPQDEWFLVRGRGQFSGPQNIGIDGFTLPLASREVVRRQQINVREITSGDFPSADPREYGKILATCYGTPDSWIRCRRTDAGIFGLTTESVVSGAQDWVVVSNDAGFDMDLLSGEQIYLNRQDTVYTVASVTGPVGQVEHQRTLTFTATIDQNIPQGALIQQKKSGGYYAFAALNQGDVGGSPVVREVAFETLDGRVVPLDPDGGQTWQAWAVADSNGKGSLGEANSATPQRLEVRIYDSAQPPAMIPRLNLPSDTAEVVQQPVSSVTQQPEFDTNETIEATKDNFPSGPGFATAAYDGNDLTGYSVPSSGGGPNNSVTFTFPSVGGNFSNSDTTRSTLHFITQGVFQVTDGSVTQFLAATSASKGQYKLVLGSPEDFDQDVRFIEQGSGGIVYEIWWTHELEAAITIDRTDDTEVDNTDVVISSTGGGNDMVPIKAMVVRCRSANTGNSLLARPERVFFDLQQRFLGEPGVNYNDTATVDTWMDRDAYDAAAARYNSEGWNLHFVVDRQFSWPELEAQVSLACRTYSWYGPNGHAIKFIEDNGTLDTVTPQAEFRLPGTPNPNCAQTPGSPIMERTAISELINSVRVYFSRNWLMPRSEDVEERYDGYADASNAESVALLGERRDPTGQVESWPQSRAIDFTVTHGTYMGWTGDNQAQRLAQFLADRGALGHTRFGFDTNGSVVGVERGDVVRVVFASAPNVYRNVMCEVESVKITPLDAHKYSLVCRTVGTPQKGLTAALYWTDVFTADGDTWAEKLTGIYDRWSQYWSAA